MKAKRMFTCLALVLAVLFMTIFFRAVKGTSKEEKTEPAYDPALSGKDLAEHLAGAVRFQTISSQDPSIFKGEEFIRFHDYLEKTFPLVHASLGRETVGEYSLLYTWEGRNTEAKPILLMAHMDVVPADSGPGSGWTHPPFEGYIADGYIWGRGSIDYKQGVMGILEAAEALLKKGFKPEKTIYLAFGHDEEIGGLKGAAQIVSLLQSRKVELDYVLDEGLLITDGVVPNVSKPVALVGIAEKGYLSVELKASGKEGHSSMPPGQTAIGILSSAIHKLEREQFPKRMEKPVRQMIEKLAPEVPFALKAVYTNLWLFKGIVLNKLAQNPSTNASIRTTTAVTMFEGGIMENVLPATARAVVNFRLLPGDTIDTVLAHITRVIDDRRVTIAPMGHLRSNPSPVSDTDSPAYRTITRTIRQVFPDVAVAPGIAVPASDSRHYSRLTKNIFRFEPVVLRAEDLGRIHGFNERISVAGYTKFVKFYVNLILNSCAQNGSTN